jgi:ABC-type multidrug transport system fused ATPase/permease subunit
MRTAMLGLQHFYAGDWRESQECLERAVGLARGTQLTRFSYVPSAYLGVLRKAQGAWEDANQCFSDAASLAREADNGEGTRYAGSRLAEMDVLQDRPAETIARLGRRPDLSDLTSFYEIVLLSALVEAHADTGDAAGAEEVADLALTQARRTRNRVDGVEALRVRAKVLSMQGRAEEAAAALEEALSWASPIPLRRGPPPPRVRYAPPPRKRAQGGTKEAFRGARHLRPARGEEGRRADRAGTPGARSGPLKPQKPRRVYTLVVENGAGIAVETVGLGKVYGEGTNEVRALSDVSLEFPDGEFAAIMGPSGSGKNTLLHILGALDKPTSGRVVVGGTELSGLSVRRLTLLRRERMGFVFQFFNLIPTLTAEENVLLPVLIRPYSWSPTTRAPRRRPPGPSSSRTAGWWTKP